MGIQETLDLDRADINNITRKFLFKIEQDKLKLERPKHNE